MGGIERIAITDRVTVPVCRTRSAQRAPWPRRVWWRQRLNIIVREHATGPDSVEPEPAHFVGYSAPQAPVFGRPGLTGAGSDLIGVGVTDGDGVGLGLGAVGTSQTGSSTSPAKIAVLASIRFQPSGIGPPNSWPSWAVAVTVAVTLPSATLISGWLYVTPGVSAIVTVGCDGVVEPGVQTPGSTVGATGTLHASWVMVLV